MGVATGGAAGAMVPSLLTAGEPGGAKLEGARLSHWACLQLFMGAIYGASHGASGKRKTIFTASLAKNFLAPPIKICLHHCTSSPKSNWTRDAKEISYYEKIL